MTNYLLLAIGGAVGTMARFGISEWFIISKWSTKFPCHTFVINVLGSFILGIFAIACKDRPQLLIFLGTGFCGGFTTFSTFGVEVVKLMDEERISAAMAYAVGSVVMGVLGAWLGMKIMK